MRRYFWMKEWDGSQELVLAQEKGSDVFIRYTDGETHRVTKAYFKANAVIALDVDLNPKGKTCWSPKK